MKLFKNIRNGIIYKSSDGFHFIGALDKWYFYNKYKANISESTQPPAYKEEWLISDYEKTYNVSLMPKLLMYL